MAGRDVVLEAGHPEQAVFWRWAEEIGLDVDGLKNSGCGCCVDLYTVQALPEQLTELDRRLAEVRR